MFKYQNTKTGEIVTRKRQIKNPASQNLRPVGFIKNMLLGVRDIIGK